MRLGSKINDNADLVNKQFVEALLSQLNSTTIAELKEAIEQIESNDQWGSYEEPIAPQVEE